MARSTGSPRAPAGFTKSPRVVLLGKNRLAVGCLKVLLDGKAEVVLVVAGAGDDGSDGWQPSLRRRALAANIEVMQPEDINTPQNVAAIGRLDPDILLSCQYERLLGRDIRALASTATLNIHFGPLPRYRGMAPIAWALLNGESHTGVTLHHIDKGIDSGDIVSTKIVPIDSTDTAAMVYERCTDASIALFREQWPAIASGDIPRQSQDDTQSLYYNRYSVDFSRRRLDWYMDCAATANRIRALIFPPFQYPQIELAGQLLEIGSVAMDRGRHAGKPGEVLSVVQNKLLVAAPGGRLFLGLIRQGDRVLGENDLVQLGAEQGVILG